MDNGTFVFLAKEKAACTSLALRTSIWEVGRMLEGDVKEVGKNPKRT